MAQVPGCLRAEARVFVRFGERDNLGHA